MKFIDDLYLGNFVKNKKNKYIRAIKNKKNVEYFYIIYLEKEKLCVSHCFSFVHKKYDNNVVNKFLKIFNFKIKSIDKDDNLIIVGLALYKNEAFNVVRQIVDDTYRVNKNFNYKDYIMRYRGKLYD